jgi:hypothetical protein
LQEYILLLAQHPKGGLADKPPKCVPFLTLLSDPRSLLTRVLRFALFRCGRCRKADFYHTANNLSGLSLAQHKLYISPSKLAQLKADWIPSSKAGPEEDEKEERRRNVFAGVLGWEEVDGQFLAVGGEQNRVVRPFICMLTGCRLLSWRIAERLSFGMQNTTHPSVNVLLLRVEPFVRHFYNQPLAASP